MNIIDIIEKKKRGFILNEAEINFFIEGVVDQSIPNYQISALLMAIYFMGMKDEEIINLTKAMVNSGDIIDLSSITKPTIDKHSTGGVGDKTSLVLAPIMATYDIAVAKMSGRGLGHTGGTLDKLESIEGFKIEINEETFINQVNEVGMSIIGQTKELVPADKILYSLRDVTATVDSIPLIASSIMSKKIASGANTIILDVKYGNGAFMKTKDNAEKLADKLVMIGNGVGRKTIACISNMDQPLGYEIGNANEILEVIDTLKGEGPSDLKLLCENLAAEFLLATKLYDDFEMAMKSVLERLNDGSALRKFEEFVIAQGGSIEALNNLKKADNFFEIFAEKEGFLEIIDAVKVGRAAMHLGAGREKFDDEIDYEAGITIYHKVGDKVKKGDKLATLYYSGNRDIELSKQLIVEAFAINQNVVEPILIVDKIIGGHKNKLN